jgi:thymidylate synthase
VLKGDPDSRQAVIHIRTPRDALLETKDHPCTIALQFLQRQGRLHMVTMMRSNDVIIGTSYDIFSFTMMQEQMALELELELGSYFHQVGSWHLYSSQRHVAEEMVEMDASPAAMPSVEPGLDAMVADEERIRRGEMVEQGTGYWRDWRQALSAFAGVIDAPQLTAGYREAWMMGRQSRASAP